MIGRKNKVLLHAWKKTGQHWLMFVLANYHKLLTENIQEPLGWVAVGGFGRKGNGYTRREWDNIRRGIKMKDFIEGYPSMLRSEANWELNIPYHSSFDKVIYLCRNPFDVLISLYFYIEKDKIRQRLIASGDEEYYLRDLTVKLDKKELWKYITNYILVYIQHLNQGYHHGDVILKYEELRLNPNLFKNAFLLFYDEIDDKLFQKALTWGGFDHVHKINPHHARNGNIGQYKEIMNNKMIQYIKRKCRKNLRAELMEELKIEEY